jgi:hypothetical protein
VSAKQFRIVTEDASDVYKYGGREIHGWATKIATAITTLREIEQMAKFTALCGSDMQENVNLIEQKAHEVLEVWGSKP